MLKDFTKIDKVFNRTAKLSSESPTHRRGSLAPCCPICDSHRTQSPMPWQCIRSFYMRNNNNAKTLFFIIIRIDSSRNGKCTLMTFIAFCLRMIMMMMMVMMRVNSCMDFLSILSMNSLTIVGCSHHLMYNVYMLACWRRYSMSSSSHDIKHMSWHYFFPGVCILGRSQ